MTKDERLLKILTATPKVLAKVDQVLEGDVSHAPEAIPDTRTCTYCEAARRLNLSRPTIYRLVRDGSLKKVELNGVSRILVQSIVDWAYNGGTGMKKGV